MRTNANAVWNTLVVTVHELKKIEEIKVLLVTPAPPPPAQLPEMLATE